MLAAITEDELAAGYGALLKVNRQRARFEFLLEAVPHVVSSSLSFGFIGKPLSIVTLNILQ